MRGTLDLMILRTLLPGPSHGHAIAKHIQRTTEDLLQVETGSLYPALYRLEAERLGGGGLGEIRQGQARAVLPHHGQGPEAAGQRTIEVGRVRARHGLPAEADR